MNIVLTWKIELSYVYLNTKKKIIEMIFSYKNNYITDDVLFMCFALTGNFPIEHSGQNRHDFRRLSYRGPSMYGNKLSTECVNVGSVNVLKNIIEKRIVRAISQYISCLLPSKVFIGWQYC